jgi:hypothetical protein
MPIRSPPYPHNRADSKGMSPIPGGGLDAIDTFQRVRVGKERSRTIRGGECGERVVIEWICRRPGGSQKDANMLGSHKKRGSK